MNMLTVIDACCAPGAPPLGEEARHDLAVRFKALADPTRVAIVNLLAGTHQLGLSQPTISHHLRILREAGLVNVERRGTWAYYSLAGETVAALAAALGGGGG